MQKICTHRHALWLIPLLAGLSVAGGVGLGRLQPVGREAGLIQFDVTSELNTDESYTNWVVFARYWVCRDYYAVSVVWSEPHGMGMVDMKTAVVLSDKVAFRMDNELFPTWVPTNTTYPKPLGERGPFRYGGGPYGGAQMRFAEAEALAGRVYVSDLGSLKDSNQDAVIDLQAAENPGGATRKLAQLRVHTRDDRIESMELLNKQQQPLCKVRYEYERDGNASPLARLIADLPVRPQKLGVNVNIDMKDASSPGGKKAYQVKEVDHVYHKGGRTCTVTYKNVAVGDTVLRLPVQVEVRGAKDKRLLRSARLMNFQRVDLDQAGVWEAAKAFAHLSSEDRAHYRLVGKYINPAPKLGPLRVDPNDFAFVRKLVAKYPVPELPPTPPAVQPEVNAGQETHELGPEARMQRARMRIEAQKQEQTQSPRMTKPPRKEIEPDDLRVMRQLERYYTKELANINGPVPKSKQEIFELRGKLSEICAYHRAPPLPEDKPPEVEPNDLELIRQLQVYYEKLATLSDRGLGGQLKAVHALTRLDTMRKDYAAFEEHTTRYLQMVQDAGLSATYMVGGHGNMETLVRAGRYEQANKLLRPWADKSAAENEPDAILRFAGWDIEGSKHDPWAGVQLLDRFLKRPALSPLQRYEGLALRAIALHSLDRSLSSLETAESELRKAQGQWVLSTTSRAEIAKRVDPALREALSAWQSLGPAREAEAKPYSTSNMGAFTMNLMGYAEATRLQETSALLNAIIQERSARTPTPRPEPSVEKPRRMPRGRR